MLQRKFPTRDQFIFLILFHHLTLHASTAVHHHCKRKYDTQAHRNHQPSLASLRTIIKPHRLTSAVILANVRITLGGVARSGVCVGRMLPSLDDGWLGRAATTSRWKSCHLHRYCCLRCPIVLCRSLFEVAIVFDLSCRMV